MPEDTKNQYGADQITVLEGLAPVRKRPGMYIGSTSESGLHHLIWEVVDNAIDEAMAGFCSHIIVKMLPDHTISVSDNGRGIPVDIHKQTKKSALETVMTMLHAGGKFEGQGYKVSGGLHGVGVSVVNALSIYTKAEVRKNGKLWVQEYKQGKALADVKPVGKANGSGTTITFRPDETIFDTLEFKWKKVVTHLRQQAYLSKGVKITIIDEREAETRAQDNLGNNTYEFYFEGGIASYVRYLNQNNTPKHPSVFYIEKENEGVMVEIALQYTEDYREEILTFANNIHTTEGGMHLAGFKLALTRALNVYARKNNILKEKDENLTGEDVREGLTSIISVKIREPQFEGQTKTKLGNSEAKTAVDAVMSSAFADFLEEHPKEAQAIIEKCNLAARARAAARAARDSVLRKGALEGFTLPGKLADCSSRNAEASELYIVEGDSAGGSTKQGRNRQFQAVLPLRGKILNVERARLDRMLANNEIKSLIIALGTNIGDQFNVENCRYHRVIIMTDADVDGAHIRTLLLTFFYRHMYPLITAGYLYIAQPPLFKVQVGKKSAYVYSEKDKEAAIKRLTNNKPEVAVNIQRYKGLGEMNPEQLWETTMNPEQRIMRQVTVEEAEEANEIFDTLMGSEVAPRKSFIQSRAKQVKNLDI